MNLYLDGTWVKCEHCEEYRCTKHSTLTDTIHASECPCPPAWEWEEEG
jgi:hypothetical protein